MLTTFRFPFVLLLLLCLGISFARADDPPVPEPRSASTLAPWTVTGQIAPEHFVFYEINAHTGDPKEPGGWREACVRARMTNAKTQEHAICEFGVGVPIVTELKGEIPIRLAQTAAAKAANLAAYTVLSQGTAPGIACAPFRKLMATLMLSVRMES